MGCSGYCDFYRNFSEKKKEEDGIEIKDVKQNTKTDDSIENILKKNYDMDDNQTKFNENALEENNTYRQYHNSPKLNLDVKLSEMAFNYAKNYSKNKDMGKYLRKNNINVIEEESDKKLSAKELFKKWYEEKNINNGFDFNNLDDKNNLVYKHFTQMIWKKSEKFGIGYLDDEEKKNIFM